MGCSARLVTGTPWKAASLADTSDAGMHLTPYSTHTLSATEQCAMSGDKQLSAAVRLARNNANSIHLPEAALKLFSGPDTL